MRSRDNIKPVKIYIVQAQNPVREWTSEGLKVPVGKPSELSHSGPADKSIFTSWGLSRGLNFLAPLPEAEGAPLFWSSIEHAHTSDDLGEEEALR